MKKKIGIIMLFGFAALLNAKQPPKIKGDWKLVWNDEFKGKKLDSSKWSFQIGNGSLYGLDDWGNNELEYYTDQNAKIKKGMLVIEARKEDKGGKAYTSSRIRTVKDDGTVLFVKTFGRIEARIKMPGGDGIWPAFWLLPATDKYGAWAASGEIDIMEAKGRLPNRVYGTVHYGQPWPGQKESGSMYKFSGDENLKDFHVYALEWEPGSLKWFVDDNLFYETHSWFGMGADACEPYKYPAPFDVPFYILLNLAVGGNFDDNRVPADYEVPARMYVDYVRVYEKISGYNTNVKRPIPPRDVKSYESYRVTNDGSFAIDPDFKSVNLQGLSKNTMDVNSGSWYFLTLQEFGGSAGAKIEDKSFHVAMNNCGSEVHSVQLLQHLGIAKGYSYKISFDARASEPRPIAVKVGGDTDNKWVVYSSQYSPKLEQEYKHFEYSFTMEEPSDASARLEFNVGKFPGDVWIKNVKVTGVEF